MTNREFTLDAQVFKWLPEIFVVLSLLLGLCYAFVTPPFQVPDEFAHTFRAYGISQGHLVAPTLTEVPQSLDSLMGRFPPHVESARKITWSEFWDEAREPLNPAALDHVPNQGMNVNTWIPYIPSATVIFIAGHLQAPALVILYLARLANLATYIALTWLALKILPAFRIVLFTVALMPMTLHQAAGLSWDSVAFAIGFLFCALVIRHAWLAPALLGRRDYAILFGSALIVSLCKVDAALLPLLLLIPGTRFPARKRQIIFLGICAAGSIAATVLWQYANRANLILFKRMLLESYKTNFPDNIWYLYYNSGYFLNALGRSILHTGSIHLAEFVGVFGWLFARLPGWAVLLYLITLLCVGLASTGLHLSWLQRGALFVVTAAGCFACILAMWLETPDFYIQTVLLHNIGTLYGIQGRHFIPFAFPGLALLSNRLIRIRMLWMVVFASIVAITVNATGILTIKRLYYEPPPQTHAIVHAPSYE